MKITPWLTLATISSVTITLLAPPYIKPIPLVLLFFIPGFALVSITLPQKDLLDYIILSIITGLAFHIVYSYLIAHVIHLSMYTLVIPSILFSIIYDTRIQYTPTHLHKKSLLILIPAVLFVALTVNAVPGEDAIAHLLLIGDIQQVNTIPTSYVLYPSIDNVYPMGFHVLIAQLQMSSGIDDLLFTFASFLSALLCLSVYFCAKKLFSTEYGLLAGTLSLFASLVPLKSLTFSTYPVILAFILTCGGIAVLISTYNQRKKQNHIKNENDPENSKNNPISTSTNTPAPQPHSRYAFILISLIAAAGIETHLIFFFILIPGVIYILQQLLKIDIKKLVLELSKLGITSLVLVSPFLLPLLFKYHSYTMTSVQYIITQEHHFFQGLTPSMLPQRIGIWVTLLGGLGFFLLKKYKLLFGAWLGIFLFMAVNTVLHIEFPLWYAFFAPRMVDQLFLPLVILTSFFLVNIYKFSSAGALFLCAVLLVSGTSTIVATPTAQTGDLFPTISPFFTTDQHGMIWLSTTDNDSQILNDWWTGTGSAWTSALVRRPLIFPYTVNAFSINVYTSPDYTEEVKTPQKERKSFIIAAYPDTKESYTHLQELNVDYIFLSAYVLEESKWRSALWNPFALQNSPNYTLVFQEGYTYIFEVLDDFEYCNTFLITDFGAISKSDTIELAVYGKKSFSVDKILDLRIYDNGWGKIIIKTDESLLAEINLTNTKTWFDAAFRIPKNTKSVSISSANDIHIKASVKTTVCESIKYNNAALIGSWRSHDNTYILEGQGHIYLFNTHKTVTITYKDTGTGNVDLNMLIDGEWKKLTTIYRENDNGIKTQTLKIPEGFYVLDIGINAWEDPFILVGLTME